MGLLIFVYPLIELFLLVKISQISGFLNTLFFIIATGLLGLMLMIMLGQASIRTLQTSFVKSQAPTYKILHRGLMFLGAFFIFLPGVLTDILGILLILPGFRHLISFYIKFLIAKGLAKGSVRIFNMGSWSAGGPFQANHERDANPLPQDVIEVNHKRIE